MTSGSLDTEITGLAYDSRLAGPGIAFVALRGSSVDGHSYIPKAIEAGCAAIIAEQAPPDGCTTPWIHVRHSRIALADAAAALNGHPGKNMTLIGVTGTNGKTTTAFLAHHLMNLGQMRCGLLGTIFYDLGGQQVPATHTTPESLEIQSLLSQMRGNSSTNTMHFGALNAASLSRQAAIIAASSPVPITTAATPSPKSRCGRPITALSTTPAISSSASSISFG